MHYISADVLYPINQPPINKGVLVVEDDGKIKDVIDPSLQEIPDELAIKHYQGAVCPGFVNAHCHLELSHLRGKINEKGKLPSFISEIIEKRNSEKEFHEEAMHKADAEMQSEGIVAVGDISNSDTSVNIKKGSKIHYHTFIELFDASEDRTDDVFIEGKSLQQKFQNAGLKGSIAPHAPYSVTGKLLALIAEEAISTNSTLSMHNQETSSENEMFQRGMGSLLDKLKSINPIYHSWKAPGKSSLANTLDNLTQDIEIQFVHNTYTSIEDIHLAHNIQNVFWCLCLKANLYIENAIPDVGLMMKENCSCTIGTDSLASNDKLSIVSEINAITNHFHSISLNNLLKMATLNGARFLKLDNTLGSFEKGKKPGINHISNLNENGNLTDNSRTTRVL